MLFRSRVIGRHDLRFGELRVQLLEQHGVEINAAPGMRAVLTRNGDYFIPLRRRTELAHQAQADFFSNLQDPAVYSTAKTVEVTDFEGKKCYKVQVMRDGRDGFEFFSVETGLLAGYTGTQPSQQGPTQMTSVIGEYMDVGGVKFPKRIEQRAGR